MRFCLVVMAVMVSSISFAGDLPGSGGNLAALDDRLQTLAEDSAIAKEFIGISDHVRKSALTSPFLSENESDRLTKLKISVTVGSLKTCESKSASHLIALHNKTNFCVVRETWQAVKEFRPYAVLALLLTAADIKSSRLLTFKILAYEENPAIPY